MSTFNSALYSAAGRLRGCFVYALLCGDRARLAVKIGHSMDPIGRLEGLRREFEAPPKTLAFVQLINKIEAERAEYLLRTRLHEHRIRGEWFAFSMADKPLFNRECAAVLTAFARPDWPIYWTKLQVASYLAHVGKKSQH